MLIGFPFEQLKLSVLKTNLSVENLFKQIEETIDAESAEYNKVLT